jgi:hypothetical protein
LTTFCAPFLTYGLESTQRAGTDAAPAHFPLWGQAMSAIHSTIDEAYRKSSHHPADTLPPLDVSCSKHNRERVAFDATQSRSLPATPILNPGNSCRRLARARIRSEGRPTARLKKCSTTRFYVIRPHLLQMGLCSCIPRAAAAIEPFLPRTIHVLMIVCTNMQSHRKVTFYYARTTYRLVRIPQMPHQGIAASNLVL